MQETPSNQQCTSAATEEGRNVGGGDPREDHGLLEDHTQRVRPQLRGDYPGDDQTLAQNPADPSNGEKTGQEPFRSQRTTTGLLPPEDPHSLLVEISNKSDTSVPDVMGRHNPPPHICSNINGKEYTLALVTTKTHRHMTPDRPNAEPPDTP